MSPSNAENNEDFKEDENSKWSTDIENDAAVEHRHPHDDRHRDFANSKISPASVKEKWRAQTKQSLQDLGVEGDVLESGRRRNSFHQRGMTPRERFGIDSPTTTKNLNEIDSASMPPGQRGPQILRQKRIQTQQTGFDIIQNNFENALTANGPSMTIQGGRLDCANCTLKKTPCFLSFPEDPLGRCVTCARLKVECRPTKRPVMPTPPNQSTRPKLSMRKANAAPLITYGGSHLSEAGNDDALHPAYRDLGADGISGVPRRPTLATNGYFRATSYHDSGNHRTSVVEGKRGRRMSYVGIEDRTELTVTHAKSIHPPSPDFDSIIANAVRQQIDRLQLTPTQTERSRMDLDERMLEALRYQQGIDRDRLKNLPRIPLISETLRRKSEISRHPTPNDGTANHGRAHDSAGRSVATTSEDGSVTVHGDEMKLRIDTSNGFEMEFEGRKVVLKPSGDGTANLIIGGKRETTYFTTRGSMDPRDREAERLRERTRGRPLEQQLGLAVESESESESEEEEDSEEEDEDEEEGAAFAKAERQSRFHVQQKLNAPAELQQRIAQAAARNLAERQRKEHILQQQRGLEQRMPPPVTMVQPTGPKLSMGKANSVPGILHGEASTAQVTMKNEGNTGQTRANAASLLSNSRAKDETVLHDQTVYEYELDISDVESVFSMGQASMSSRTSIASIEFLDDTTAQAVSMIMTEESLAPLCLEAIQSSAIGPERFARNFKRLLKQYGASLKVEASKKEHRAAANFILRRAGPIADKICEACNKRLQRKPTEKHSREAPEAEDTASCESSDAECASDKEGPKYLTHLTAVEAFMKDGQPFQMLCANLSNFIKPSWQHSTRELLDRISNKRTDVLSDRELDRLKGLIDDLTFIPPHEISIHATLESSSLERTQQHIEIWTKTMWLWWPLGQPRGSLRNGYRYIRWNNAYGDDEWEQVPEAFASKFQRILEKAQGLLSTGSDMKDNEDSNGKQQHTCQGGQDASLGMSTSTTLASQGSSSSSTTRNSIVDSANTPVPHLKLAQEVSINLVQQRFVFIAVSQGDDHHLGELEVQGLEDDCFFQQLREEYFRQRGILYRWLSIWVYNHCDFVMIEKTGESEIDPIERGMPHDGDHDYEFKKVGFKPPVSPRQFHRRFYRCYKGGKRHSHFLRPCNQKCSEARDALLRIPKRKNRVAETVDEEKENIFWGLLAVEGISFVRICLCHVLFITGPFVFWGLWLTVMGHPGDLQNASIPFLAALGLLSIFWFLLGHR